MANNKNEYYTECPIRLIQCVGSINSIAKFVSYLVVIYEKDGMVSDMYIRLNGPDNNTQFLNIPDIRFVDDESVVVWKTTVEKGVLSGEKRKTELVEVRINKNFQSKI